ncbi:hypothetical protein RGQ29_026147 [Quercus rubra]|uniref:Uncharacterized protein n=1 Tax=Quercus rubra TaxID=3512 RepID=A0AAN7F0X6_QUERU|nr:hypothetical protein RGQ29_026147 [Quercus rubra]
MSNHNIEEERRLYRCAVKYEKMVKQFDELIGIMNTTKTRPPKRQRGSKENSSSSTAAPAASSSQQPENNEVFVQTITRFLQELKTDPTDPDSSTNTSD